MLDFYQTMLNIQKWDPKEAISIIERSIKLEMLENSNISTTNLYDKLNSYGINTKMINLNEIYREMKDHVFLIVSYQDLNNNFNYILIDPSYEQFVKKENKKSPLYYEAWPSEILQNINPDLLNNLLRNKYSFINDKYIQDYLRSFTNKEVNNNLETIILEKYKEKARRI